MWRTRTLESLWMLRKAMRRLRTAYWPVNTMAPKPGIHTPGMKTAALLCLLLPSLSFAAGLPDRGPVELVDASVYRDGGTKSVLMRSGTGKSFSFCLDGRLQLAGATRKSHVYLGARHPTHAGAELIGIGSPEEQQLVALLRQWKQVNIPEGLCERRGMHGEAGTRKMCIAAEILRTLEKRQPANIISVPN